MSYISAISKDDMVLVWERDKNGERTTKEYNAPYYFYIDDAKGDELTIFDTPVKKIDCGRNRTYFYQQRKKYQEKNIRIWESDISPELRVLSNMYYEIPAPVLNITFLDIEIDFQPFLYEPSHKVRVRKKSKL